MVLRLNESWRFENWDLIWWVNCRRGPCGLNAVGQVVREGKRWLEEWGGEGRAYHISRARAHESKSHVFDILETFDDWASYQDG